jgi:chromosome segregation protein
MAQLQNRTEEAEARFEALDMQLAQTQERHANLQEKSHSSEQQLNAAREGLRQRERQVQEADFSLRSLSAKLAELQRTQETAAQQIDKLRAEHTSQQAELVLLSDSAAQSGLQDALAVKLERESLLAANALNTMT